MAHSIRARRALAHLPEVDPGLAALALWCTHRDGPGVTRTQGDTIIYGDAFTDHPLHEQVGLLGHHVLHVALRHSWRMGAMALRQGDGFNPDLFNRVADALVNDTLLAADHGLPRPCVTLADVVPGETTLADWDVERLYHAARQSGGTGNGETPRVQRDLEPDPTGDSPDSGAADWRTHLERALAIGRQAGRGIGSATAPLGDLPPANVPWERHLRRLVARQLDDTPRQTHRRPTHVWIAAEATARAQNRPIPGFQPAMLRGRLRPLVVIGLDTSGSVDIELLRRFGAEISGIAQRTGAQLHLLAFDETVHLDQPLDPTALPKTLAKLSLRRDGGTCFDDVLQRADALSPSITVILTDLDGPLAHRPRHPVLWACPGPVKHLPQVGRVLVMDGGGAP